MGLFGFGKKKEKSCECNKPVQEAPKGCGCGSGSDCSTQNADGAEIIVLGACCKKSSETFENVKTAVSEMGLSEQVVNIGDMAQIAKYGVMSTPALVLKGKVVAMGTLIKVEQAKELIKKAGFEEMAMCDCGNMCKVSDIEAKQAEKN